MDRQIMESITKNPEHKPQPRTGLESLWGYLGWDPEAAFEATYQAHQESKEARKRAFNVLPEFEDFVTSVEKTNFEIEQAIDAATSHLNDNEPYKIRALPILPQSVEVSPEDIKASKDTSETSRLTRKLKKKIAYTAASITLLSASLGGLYLKNQKFINSLLGNAEPISADISNNDILLAQSFLPKEGGSITFTEEELGIQPTESSRVGRSQEEVEDIQITAAETFTTEAPITTSTLEPSDTPASTNTPESTDTPEPTDTSTIEVIVNEQEDTVTYVPSATNTPTWTPTNTPTQTATATETNTATPTYTPTKTSTSTPSTTPSLTPSSTPSPTDTLTSTPTSTPTDTATNTTTATFTPTETATATHTSTETPTQTNTPTETSSPTNTPEPTITATPTSENSPTPETVETVSTADFFIDSITETLENYIEQTETAINSTTDPEEKARLEQIKQEAENSLQELETTGEFSINFLLTDRSNYSTIGPRRYWIGQEHLGEVNEIIHISISKTNGIDIVFYGRNLPTPLVFKIDREGEISYQLTNEEDLEIKHLGAAAINESGSYRGLPDGSLATRMGNQADYMEWLTGRNAQINLGISLGELENIVESFLPDGVTFEFTKDVRVKVATEGGMEFEYNQGEEHHFSAAEFLQFLTMREGEVGGEYIGAQNRGVAVLKAIFDKDNKITSLKNLKSLLGAINPNGAQEVFEEIFEIISTQDGKIELSTDELQTLSINPEDLEIGDEVVLAYDDGTFMYKVETPGQEPIYQFFMDLSSLANRSLNNEDGFIFLTESELIELGVDITALEEAEYGSIFKFPQEKNTVLEIREDEETGEKIVVLSQIPQRSVLIPVGDVQTGIFLPILQNVIEDKDFLPQFIGSALYDFSNDNSVNLSSIPVPLDTSNLQEYYNSTTYEIIIE